ncbi:MAG: glycosyltransferase [Rhodospirillaceae bacterium]|nr:glycosyltransferase [Rhodospirillaceae bacterium]MBT5357993.1 glycosyltransferase [Rhodospirillaceae bacterium]MBT6309122.1 glycosyltransferase [Rhodospirillaceae bacterium]
MKDAPAMDFSLVITNYNRERFIDRAIRSCLMQIILRRPIEIIVVDDASTDGSLDIIREFSHDVQVFEQDRNQGVAAASNVGLANASGRYWMRVDADDFLNTYACAFLGSILDENPDIDFVYCDHHRVDLRGVKVSRVRLDNDETLFEHGAGVLFRTEKLREIGGYDEDLRNAEDRDLLMRLRAAGSKGYYLPVSLYRYYIHGANISLGDDRDGYRSMVTDRHSGD